MLDALQTMVYLGVERSFDMRWSAIYQVTVYRKCDQDVQMIMVDGGLICAQRIDFFAQHGSVPYFELNSTLPAVPGEKGFLYLTIWGTAMAGRRYQG